MKDRRGSDSVARKIMLRVLSDNKSHAEVVHEASQMQAKSLGLPVNWSNNGAAPVSQTTAAIVGPDGNALGAFGASPNRVCGECKKFNLERGRKEMMAQRFAERLVRDDRWQLHHLGVPMDHIGMCEESGGTMVTCSVSNADNCAGYKKR